MRPIATDVAWSVCLFFCLLVTLVSPAKTDKRIEMPFGMRTRVGLRNLVLNRGVDPLDHPSKMALFGKET